MFGLCAASSLGHLCTGFAEYNSHGIEHGAPPASFVTYLQSGQLLESVHPGRWARAGSCGSIRIHRR